VIQLSIVRIALIATSLAFASVIVRLVKRKQLTMKYSFLWIILLFVILLCAILPIIPYRISDILGFETPANFIFLVAIFFLLAIALSLSIIVSKQQRKITTLIQEVAILENNSKTNFDKLKTDIANLSNAQQR
jgi:hypothetical protein